MPAASVTSEFVTPRPIAGYRVVATAFLLAVFAWGHGFYGLSVYVQFLGGPGGWSPTLLSAATTFYFVLGALAAWLIRNMSRITSVFLLLIGAYLLARGIINFRY